MADVDAAPSPRVVVPAGLGASRAGVLQDRVDRWWPDVAAGLAVLYPDDVEAVGAALLEAVTTAYVCRPDTLHQRDVDRTQHPDWLQDPSMVGYACYTERFAGDLRGVIRRLPYLGELGVRYLHLMPLLHPRDGDSDGGYAVADYRAVRADLGTMDDLSALAAALHQRGMNLTLDLVLNHVAREHEWATKARAGDPRYQAYFHTFPDRTMPDMYERTLPEVFPDFAPGSFTWDADLDGWVWTTFNEWQWDVNWANPDVLVEYAAIVLDLANRGVDVLRLDAIAFMWKRMGTDCQGQPEVHAITRVLRAVARIGCPALAFKAEAIVAPAKLLAYLGDGEYRGKVSDLAYHNSLMVQTWSMLATRDVRLTAQALGALPPKPASATWLTYVRCHDDIGWAVMDEDAAAVGLSGPAHRSFLAHWYAGDFPGSPARGLIFQHNPDTDDRRTSGSAASLVGLDAAQSPADVDRAASALRLAHALVVGWGGIPVIWSGDELGLPNDPAWAYEPGHAEDNRWAHRPRLDWTHAAGRHDPSTVPGRVFGDLAHLLRVRASLPHLHGSVDSAVGPVDDPGVLVTLRDHPAGRFAGVYNVTPEPRRWPGWRVRELGLAEAVDALTGDPIPWADDDDVLLPPYAALWLT
ncbi:MAG: amylosucrase [Dermatophilaceae bacterium]